jgi:hypothetical protein
LAGVLDASGATGSAEAAVAKTLPPRTAAAQQSSLSLVMVVSSERLPFAWESWGAFQAVVRHFAELSFSKKINLHDPTREPVQRFINAGDDRCGSLKSKREGEPTSSRSR